MPFDCESVVREKERKEERTDGLHTLHAAVYSVQLKKHAERQRERNNERERNNFTHCGTYKMRGKKKGKINEQNTVSRHRAAVSMSYHTPQDRCRTE
jgi:hypothetical protein